MYTCFFFFFVFFFFQAEDGIRDIGVTGVQTCALPISQHFPFYSDEGLTSETSVSIRSFLRCRINMFITKLYQIAEYSRCPVYQVLHQVTEDLDTKKKKKKKRGKPKLGPSSKKGLSHKKKTRKKNKSKKERKGGRRREGGRVKVR